MSKRLILASLAAASCAFAALEGVVVNGTTGAPQAGVNVLVIQPSQKGMEPLGVAKSDAAGKFKIDKDPAAGTPSLVQATHLGVTYTTVVQPNQPKQGVQVAVYEVSDKRDAVGIDRHGVLFQPEEKRLLVQEFVFVDNKGNTTYNDAKNGTYQFFVPGGVPIDIQVTAPGSMAVKRPAEKAGPANTYKITFPMRPGQTQIEMTYEYPATNPLTFSGNILHKDGETRLIVPRGLKLEGEGLEAFAPEPQTQSPIYGVKAGPYTVTISGKAEPPEPDEDPGMNEVKALRPRIYDRYYWILGISLAILGAGLWLVAMKRNPPPPASAPGAQSGAGKSKKK